MSLRILSATQTSVTIPGAGANSHKVGGAEMARATWKGIVLAESDRFEIVEGNVYFPANALDRRFFKESTTTTICPWKGKAHYYSVVVDGAENSDAAWYYPDPKP